MSLGGAMTSAISALRANAQALGMIGDNVANSQTHGYKPSHALFRSLISEGRAFSYNPAGVSSYAWRNTDNTSTLEQSDSPTHLMIDGQGFFITSRTTLRAPQNLVYTRAGGFDFDQNGYLCNKDGDFVLGWKLNAQGQPVKADGITPANTSSLEDLVTVQTARVSGLSRATTQIALSANLPSNIAGLDAATQQTTILRVYDSLGAGHDLTFNWQKTNNAPLTWTVAITGGAGDVVRKTNGGGDIIGRPVAGGTAPVTIVFDNQGRPATFDGNPNPPPLFVTWNGTAAAAQTMALDLGQVGGVDGLTSRAGDFQTLRRYQDGEKTGTFTGVSVDAKGVVKALFDTGQSLDLWQVPLAVFPNANALTPCSGTGYVPNALSGDPVVTLAQGGASGVVVDHALEASGVDLAAEFTDMIVTQRSYSAASKVIMTADEMFEALERIKR